MASVLEITARADMLRAENPDLFEAAQLIRQTMIFGRHTIYAAFEAGCLLNRAKACTAHGAWLPALKSYGINYQTASRLMTLNRGYEISQLVKFGSVHEALQNLKEEKYNPHASNSGYSEWYTPKFVILTANRTMDGITLDPCSCDKANETVRADRFFTQEDNGLKQDWSGERVWLNPPFDTRNAEAFTEKFIAEDIECGCLLLPALVASASYGQKLLENSAAVCFLAGRLKFEGPRSRGHASQQNSMICYRGKGVDKFIAEFAELGTVLGQLQPAVPLLKVVN